MNAAPASVHASLGGKQYDAFLFDMDGTLLTSIEASRRVWGRWAAKFGLNAATFLPDSHGMQVVDVIARLKIPGVDPATEADAILRGELADMDGVREIRGAAAFLASLPSTQWGVVTSAPRVLAQRRLAVAGLPTPPVLVAADDVGRGKPDPECYRLAAERIGVKPADCLVFEDARAGIAAAEAAGADVLVVTAAHTQPITTEHPAVRDYAGLAVGHDAGRRKIMLLARPSLADPIGNEGS